MINSLKIIKDGANANGLLLIVDKFNGLEFHPPGEMADAANFLLDQALAGADEEYENWLYANIDGHGTAN